MPIFLGIVAPVLGTGGFAVYPWGGDSRLRIIIAIVLWAVAFLLAVTAGYLEHKERKERKERNKSEGGGGDIVDPRESLRRMLIDAYNEGLAINMRKDVAEGDRDAPPWQAKVGALLRESLFDQGCYLTFQELGPYSEKSRTRQLLEQTRHLANILQNFSDYDLKATWLPPTLAGH